jgi:hypothetical protein
MNKVYKFSLIILLFLCLNINITPVFAQNTSASEANSSSTSTASATQENTNKSAKNQSSYALYKEEINKRFKGGDWEKDLTKLSERALIQEYVRIIGISNHLANMNMEKKQRIEALLATYTAIQMQNKAKLLNK